MFSSMRVFAAMGVGLVLAACGGGGGSSNSFQGKQIPYSVGGTITGLSGSGLVLQNTADSDSVLVNANSSTFTFTNPVVSGTHYAVAVGTQPSNPSQTCTLTPATASGTVNDAAVVTIAVECTTNSYPVNVTVSGLTGSGLVLQNNGTDHLAVNASDTGTRVFATQVLSNAPYAVTVLTPPNSPAQTCTVNSPNAGTVTAAAVNVSVTCSTTAYTIGGTVTGLSSGATVVLADNNGESLPVVSTGATTNFTFNKSLASGALYSVAVETNPGYTSPSSPAQTCTVTPATASGTITTAAITNVAVTCAITMYSVNGTVSGLSGSGLTLQIQVNGVNRTPQSVSGNSFSFANVPSGATYAVIVATQPSAPTQTCVANNATGTVTNADATIATPINCTIKSFTIGGSVTGLSGTGLVLEDNGGDDLSITANGTFVFNTPINSGSHYVVTVATRPSNPDQSCAVANGAGTVAGSNITNVTITCATNTFTIGGSVTGLTGTGLVLRDNGGDDLAIGSNGAFVFHTTVASGANYNVTVATQPTGPMQYCAVTSATGTVTNVLVNTIAVNCVSNFGRFAYVGNAAIPGNSGPGYWQYAIDFMTGVLTPLSSPTIGSAPVFPLPLLIHPSNKFAYSFADGNIFSINSATGTLSSNGTISSPVNFLPGVVGNVDASGHYAYVMGYTISSDGGGGLGGPPNLIATGYIIGFSVNATTGQLTSPYTQSIGSTPPAGITLTPNGATAYLSNDTTNAIERYSLSNGTITYAAAAISGTTTTIRVIHPNGLHMYVGGVTANAITQYDIAANGSLISVGSPIAAGTSPSMIVIDPTGKYAYALSNTDNAVAQFTIGPTTGALTAMSPATVATGSGPTAIAIEGSSRFAYVTCSGDSTIVQYTIGSSGALTRTNTTTTAPLGTPSSIAIAGPAQ